MTSDYCYFCYLLLVTRHVKWGHDFCDEACALGYELEQLAHKESA